MANIIAVYDRTYRAVRVNYQKLHELCPEHGLLKLVELGPHTIYFSGKEFEKKYYRKVMQPGGGISRLRTSVATLSGYEADLKKAIIELIKRRK